MKQKYQALITEQSVTVFNNGKRLIAHSDHPLFKKIVRGVRENAPITKLEKLFQLKQTIEKCFNVEIKNNDEVFYKGSKVNNVLTEKILNAVRKNLPYKPWIKFLNNLMQNPSEYCREQLFNYVQNYGLAIDSNGWVYGYKAVGNKLLDKHTGTVKYQIGRTIKVDRTKCETSEQTGCGFGLHVGETSYVKEYGNNSGDRFLLLKFNPKDCMSCPTDCDWKKLRVCSLKVVKELNKEELMPLADTYIGQLKKKG